MDKATLAQTHPGPEARMAPLSEKRVHVRLHALFVFVGPVSSTGLYVLLTVRLRKRWVGLEDDFELFMQWLGAHLN